LKEQGIINPIIATYKLGEKYRLVAGERRTLASIPCRKRRHNSANFRYETE